MAPIPARTSAELHECRQCCSFCDRVVHPSGCIASGCQYLYLYDDEETGRRFMGCMHKVFRGEIDVELFEQAERTRHGFGGVKMTGLPLPQCRSTVERAYDGYTRGLRLREPALLPQAGARGRARRSISATSSNPSRTPACPVCRWPSRAPAPTRRR